MSKHKYIWVFGKDDVEYPKNAGDPACNIYLPGARIQYWKESQMRADINRLDGARPHLIINLSEPFEELMERQRFASALHSAPILQMWK